MALKKINYNGSSKVILRLCEMVNQLIDGGGGGSTVTYTQTLSSGIKTGEISIDGVSTDMYAPTQPTKVSDLQNDSGFITNTVNNLTNYYLKSETYTQAEVNALIAQIVTLSVLVVQTLPTQDIDTHTIYLVPKQTAGTNDVYDEYMYINNAWELIGTTQIDLSNYYTKSETDTLLNAKVADNPTFTEASTRANIASGESFATILGKIKKFFTDLKTVAFTGSYDDLTNKPTIPDAQIQSDWTQTTTTAKDYIKNKPSLATVATSGSYNDLSNKPTIPTVNNATLTIQKNGTTVKTFTANASSNVTANITVPTKTSDLTNDSFATVATSGSYTDLSDKPTIPDEQIQSDWNQSDNTKKDFIKNKPTIPTNTDHRATFFGTCATSAGTKDKVVTLSDTTGWELRKGVVVGVKYTYTNTYNATASNKITLNVNSTGAKSIYAGNTASPTGTSWVYFGGANRIHYYMYDGTYWVFLSHSADNDSGNYNLRFPDAWIAEKAITAVNCCVGTSAGYKPIASGEIFDIAYPVVYSGNAIAVGATTTNFFVYGNNLLLSSVKADFTGTVSSMLYLVGSAFDGKNFTIDSTIATCTPNVSGKYYLPIGTCFSTSRFDLYPVGHVFYYDGTNLKTITGNALTVNGHTVNKDVPSNAVFTDTNVTQTATSTNANYEVLFSATADNTTRTETARKDTGLTFNPSTDTLSTKYVNHKVLKALTGSGTAGSDAGASVSPRYTPSLWTFNAGVTVANGEVYLIKIPVAGGTYGVWLSLNNGTNYYPVAVSNGKARFTTHYAKDTVIAVTYESAGVCTCYARTGADTTADVTSIFRVLNDYDANTTYSNMSANELSTGTATNARSISAKVLTDWLTGKLSTKVSKSGDFINGVLVIDAQNGTTSSVGKSQINLGNSIPEGTDKNSYGRLVLYGTGTNYTFLQATNSTADRTIELPDKTGTLAITDDIPFKATIITETFSNNQTNKQYVITLPEFSNICKVSIELNHSQDFYGRYVELYISRHDTTRLGVIEKINVSENTQYNDFTYAVNNTYATRTITLSITTGSNLGHNLKVVIESR